MLDVRPKKDCTLFFVGRIFALDRIVSIEPCDIPYRENPDFDSEHFFDDVIGVSKNISCIPRVIKFWATSEQGKFIRIKLLHPSQCLAHCYEDGSCVFCIKVVINFELYCVFMSYAPGIKVLSPRNIFAYMRDKLREAADYYDNDSVPEGSSGHEEER